MKINLQQKPPAATSRPAYRTLQGWALGTLIDLHAVRECDHHGHTLDRADPDARNRAREYAWNHPFTGTSPEVSVAAVEEVLQSIGDTCPECH
jgi:hypothetical protein